MGSDGGRKNWRTEISSIQSDSILVRGYDLEDLIGLPFSSTVYLLMRGRLPSPQETRVVDALLTAILDYGLEKSGTLAARTVVSSNPSMQAGLATAILGAGQHSVDPSGAAQFIIDQHAAWSASGLSMAEYSVEAVAGFQQRRFRVPGFGHPSFRHLDPRAQKLKLIASTESLWGEPARLYEAIHAEFVKNPKVAHFPMNDVGVLAAIAVALGFTPQETTALAVIGTLPGVAAHVSEELSSGRLVRGVPRDEVEYAVEARDFATDFSARGWLTTEANVCEPKAP